jgi:hypothetical protein
MVSFDNLSSNKMVSYVLYAVAAIIVLYLAYKVVQKLFPTIITPSAASDNTISAASLYSLGNAPSMIPGEDVNESDFNYLGGTQFTAAGVNAMNDPSNDVQKYTLTQDINGRPFWQANQMSSTNDFLTKGEFDGILDRHINRNMVPNIKYMTLPKYIRNSSNTYGTYRPTENTYDKCLDVHDVQNEGGLLGSDPYTWGQ